MSNQKKKSDDVTPAVSHAVGWAVDRAMSDPVGIAVNTEVAVLRDVQEAQDDPALEDFLRSTSGHASCTDRIKTMTCTTTCGGPWTCRDWGHAWGHAQGRMGP